MPEPLRIDDHAVDHLRYIRETMERAGSFTSIPGWGGFIIGWTAVAAAVIAHPFSAAGERRWVAIWLLEAIIAAVIAALAIERKRRRASAALFTGAARRFFISYFAPITAAAVLTLVLVRNAAVEALPATWLLLYGASFISSGAFSIRLVPVMGICFMTLGLTASFVSLSSGNVLMAVGFGGVHIVFGWIIGRNHGG